MNPKLDPVHALPALLDASIERLPKDYKTILQLVHRHGFSMAESAEQMDRSAEAARKLYGRAVSLLAEKLESIRGETRGDAGHG